MRVFLFSDRASIIAKVDSFLTAASYTVVNGSDIAVALNTINGGNFSAVLVDMAHSEARQLLTVIAERTADQRIVVMTILKLHDQHADIEFGYTVNVKFYTSQLFNAIELPIFLSRAISGDCR